MFRERFAANYIFGKLNEDYETLYTNWTPTNQEKFSFIDPKMEMQQKGQPSPSFYTYSIYLKGKKSYLMFSLNGKQVTLYSFDWDEFKISNDEEDYFIGINAQTYLDFVPFVEKPVFLESLKESNTTCNEWNSDCLLDIRTIYNEDGSYGYLVIQGERVEKERFYKNITITRY